MRSFNSNALLGKKKKKNKKKKKKKNKKKKLYKNLFINKFKFSPKKVKKKK